MNSNARNTDRPSLNSICAGKKVAACLIMLLKTYYSSFCTFRFSNFLYFGLIIIPPPLLLQHVNESNKENPTKPCCYLSFCHIKFLHYYFVHYRYLQTKIHNVFNTSSPLAFSIKIYNEKNPKIFYFYGWLVHILNTTYIQYIHMFEFCV